MTQAISPMRRLLTKALPFLLPMTFAAGCQTDASSPDAEDAVAVPGGKADDLSYPTCLIDEVVNLVNDPATTSESLRAGGLHTRAANAIIKARNGADEMAGTADDVVFTDINAVDNVRYVGPVALEQLTAMVTCDDMPTEEVEVIFSPQAYDRSHLARMIELIDGAEESLDVAMYSLSDRGVMDALRRAGERGVSIRMIYNAAMADRRDDDGGRSAILEEMGIDVRGINKIMHHKYVLVDGPRDDASNTDGVLATGSGNWSNSAGVRYDENTVIFHGNAEMLLRYQREFDYLWAHSRGFDWVDHTRLDTQAPTEADIAAVDGEDAAAFFTSANFRTTNSTRYGPGFSVMRGSNEVADQLAALILSAEESIRIASGHLRSRPVSEALYQALDANPDLEVQVYTDAQEFLSEYSHARQLVEREECLVDAVGSQARTQDCYDRGFLYAYDYVQHGIDVRFKYYSYRWHYTYAAQMHHKYLIIDDSLVATGSYNLSDNAEHATMENVVVLSGDTYADVVQRFVDNFNAMWETGREGATSRLYDDLMYDVENGSDPFPIVFDSMALAWDEVDVLKRAMRTACPEINSTDFRRNPQRHFSCTP